MNGFTFRRRATKLTQAQVAEKLGLSQSTVAKWENGTALPRGSTLLEVADLYQCTVEELFDYTETKKS